MLLTECLHLKCAFLTSPELFFFCCCYVPQMLEYHISTYVHTFILILADFMPWFCLLILLDDKDAGYLESE